MSFDTKNTCLQEVRVGYQAGPLVTDLLDPDSGRPLHSPGMQRRHVLPSAHGRMIVVGRLDTTESQQNVPKTPLVSVLSGSKQIVCLGEKGWTA